MICCKNIFISNDRRGKEKDLKHKRKYYRPKENEKKEWDTKEGLVKGKKDQLRAKKYFLGERIKLIYKM
jgi:hypothetical protein